MGTDKSGSIEQYSLLAVRSRSFANPSLTSVCPDDPGPEPTGEFQRTPPKQVEHGRGVGCRRRRSHDLDHLRLSIRSFRDRGLDALRCLVADLPRRNAVGALFSWNQHLEHFRHVVRDARSANPLLVRPSRSIRMRCN